MIRLDEVRARIAERVPELADRIGNAADFGHLIDGNELPDDTGAYVLPGGLRGGAPDAATGLFRQALVETVLVVVAVRTADDPTGEAALDEATPLVRKVIEGVVGWVPEGPPAALGTMQLGSAELVGSSKGVLVFQIDFQLNDQLRIAT